VFAAGDASETGPMLTRNVTSKIELSLIARD